VAAWLNGSSTGLTAGIYITNPGCRTKRTNFRLDPHRIADLRTLRISAVSLANTSSTSTTTDRTRGRNQHPPTTTQRSSSPSTRRSDATQSSAASSTSTTEQHEPALNRQAKPHGTNIGAL
jgi:hypothetical protein